MQSKRRSLATLQASAAPPSGTAEKLLPESLYAEIAPVPVPFAEHHLRRVRKAYPQEPLATVLELFLAEVRSTRETAFEVMDDFVRNRNAPVPPDLRLSTEWLTRTLAAYDPAQTMPKATYKNWQRRGIIRMEAHGKPQPSSAAATLMMRMMNRQKEHLFPEVFRTTEPDYWCNVIETPSHRPEVIPVNALHLLPPSALVWTPWAGAAWEDCWHIIGEHETNQAAIRFAGTKLVKGELWWDVDVPDLEAWDRLCASLYIAVPGHHERQVQDLATIVLTHVYAKNVPIWSKQLKTVSARIQVRKERQE